MKIYLLLFSLFILSACSSNTKPDTASNQDTLSYHSLIDRAKRMLSPQAQTDTTPVETQTEPVMRFSNVEMWILDTLKRMPEVRRQQRRLDSLTDHTDKVSFILNPPTFGNRNYIVQVGDMHGDQFELYYLFYIQSDSLVIRVSDNSTNYLLSLDQWRKMLTQRD